MTLKEIFNRFELPAINEEEQVKILLKAWPDYLHAARALAAEEYECLPEQATQPMIKKYLCHMHEYDAVEISHILKEASRMIQKAVICAMLF